MELYDSLDMAELTEEFNRLETKKSGNYSNILDKFVMLPKDGPLTVRLLPPAKGKKFYCATRIHKLVMPNEQIKNVHCTRNLKVINGNRRWLDDVPKDPCPICTEYYNYYNKADLAKKRGDNDTYNDLVAKAKAIKPMERYYYNCIIRQQINSKTGEVEKNVGPKILSVGQTLHLKIVTAIIGNPQMEETPLGDVTSLKDGRDFKIMKTKKGDYPDYAPSKFLDPSVLGDKDQIKRWLESLHDLSELRRLISHADMKVEFDKYLGKVEIEDDTTFEAPESTVVRDIAMDMGHSGNNDKGMTEEEFFDTLEKL